jgi:hypothetical protein
MLCRESAENSCADFLFSVFEKDWVLDYCHETVMDRVAPERNIFLIFEGKVLFLSTVLSDRHREETLVSNRVSQGLHLQYFKKLGLIHEFIERVGPSLGNSLKILNLLNINID